MGAARLTVHKPGRSALALLLPLVAVGTTAGLTLRSPAPTFADSSSTAAPASVPASATAPGVAGVTEGTGGETWFANLSASEQASWIRTMVTDGVKWLRLDSPGNLAGWYDTEMKDAEAAGINVDAGIETWGMSSVTPSTMGPMCTGQVQLLEPLGVQTYEVINEPNADGGPNYLPAAQYEPLLAACYTAIKAADPGATVLMGGLAQAGGSDAAATYLAAVYAAGGEPYFDAMNMHPEDWDSAMDQTPTSPADCPDNAWNPWVDCPDTPTNVAGGQQAEISAVRTVMDANGDSSKAIWFSEFGCPTGTDGGYAADCDDAQLATQITDGYQQLQANPGDEYGLLGPMFVYDWIDTNSTDDPNGTGYDDFGLYADTGAPKPGVLSAFEAGAALAGGSKSTVSAPSWSSGNPTSVTVGDSFTLYFSLGGASSGTIYGSCPGSSWGSATVTGTSYTDGGCAQAGAIQFRLTNSAGTSSTLDVTNTAGGSKSTVSAPSWSSGNPTSVTVGDSFTLYFSLGGASSGTIYGSCPGSSWGSATVTGTSYTDGGCAQAGAIQFRLTNSAGTSTTLDVTNTAAASPAPTDSASAVSAVGNLTSALTWSVSSASLPVDPKASGDALVLAVSAESGVSTVTGGGATWSRIIQDDDTSAGWYYELWLGTVTSPGASTVKVTLSSPSSDIELGAQEFSSTYGSATTWSVDKTGALDNTSNTTITYPSLTPAETPELYFGFANVVYGGASPTSGTNPGFTYSDLSAASFDQVTYDGDVAGAVQPTSTVSSPQSSVTVGVLLAAM